MPSRITQLSAVLPVLYVASGAAALMLEVTWSRLLTLQFGHTTGATSTVLAAFMGGLAAGSACGGRLAERMDRRASLAMYAGLEAVIALSAVALPLLIAAATPVLEWAYADGHTPVRFGVARVLVSLIALAAPTFAMGATYPLATRALSPDRGRGERAAGWLYSANTLGAACGALTAGFVLLPAAGMRATSFAAAALHAIAASGGWWLSTRLPRAETEAVAAREPSRMPSRPGTARAVASAPRLAWLGLIAAATSGFVALIAQVAWTRVLALIVGPTTFAFSAMVGVFIAGLAAGAAVGSRLARGQRAAAWLGVMGLGGAVSTIVSMRLVDILLLSIAADAAPPSAFDIVIWRELAVAAALLGPLSVTFGAAFPLALAVVAGGGGLTPTRLAWTYAANSAGAIAGALLAGFVLIPLAGLQASLRIGACASTIVSLFVLGAARPSTRARMVSIAAAVAIVAGTFTLGSWNPALLSSGAYRFAPSVPSEALEPVLTAGDLLFYNEGAAATVAVRRLAGTTSLLIDGKPDASNAGDMLTQKLLAHLPLLLHPDPKRACVLGLGSGVTAGAALTHPLERLDVVEISPRVVDASRFFRAENRDALADARTRLLLADGRSHLRLSTARYDVVISEPSNPWMAGVAALFTREFMTAVRDRLAPGGIFCQWTHTYDMSDADLRSIVATFVDVFPQASLWLVGESDALLIGSTAPLASDAATLAARFTRAGVAEDLKSVDVSRAGDLAGLHVADTAALHEYASGAATQSDNRMALEFSAPRSLASRTGRGNVDALLALAPHAPDGAIRISSDDNAPPDPEAWLGRGRMLLRAEAYDLAFSALSRAVALGRTDEEALDAFIRAAAGAHKEREAIAQLRASIGGDAVPARVALARLLMSQEQPDEAVAVLSPAFADQAPPSTSSTPALRDDEALDPRALRELASIFADLGDAQHLEQMVARLNERAPDAIDTRYYDASLAFLRGAFADAIRLAQSVVTRRPNDAKAHNLLGAAFATLGRAGDARAAFARSIAADPRASNTYVNAGSLELAHGDPHAARDHFAVALALDPFNDAARQGLARAIDAIAHR